MQSSLKPDAGSVLKRTDDALPPRERGVLLSGLRIAAAGMSAATSGPSIAGGSADIDPNALIVKLVHRLTMGFTQQELQLALTLGYSGYLEHHLGPPPAGSVEEIALAARLLTLATLTMTYPQMLALNNSGLVENELIEATILRARMSTRQIFERMVELWTDHFSVEISGVQHYKAIHDRDVIRPLALGNFPSLLAATAQSPAMLYYLGNHVSIANNLNENFSRELLELHSLGADGGYTQQDVEEVARCFTGWTVWGDNAGTLSGSFRYNNQFHDQGQKTVLGHIIPPNGGMQDGLTVLNILAGHPSTASHVARKICHKFLGENTPAHVIQSVASVYLATGGDIRAMLRETLKPEHLYDAPRRFKRPFHLMIAAMRAVPTTITSTSALRWQLHFNGHLLFHWMAPDGYPDILSHWSGLLLPRWNFGSTLMNGALTGCVPDIAGFFAGLSSAEAMADRINQALFGGEMPVAERNRIRDFLLPEHLMSLEKQREALALAVASPAFQWY